MCLTIGLATPSWADATLLNVSYDVTQGFYNDYTSALQQYLEGQDQRNRHLQQSHGGSGKQAMSGGQPEAMSSP